MLGENGVRDTLGVLVNSVVDNGPAAKAGLKEGDRIQAIGGVNLKMTRDDANDDALSGMMSRRLVRELDKLKAGDEVEMRIYSGGAERTVRMKTVAARELASANTSQTTREPLLHRFRDDRAALGLSLGGRVTKRDTLGVFVMIVTADGPAEKAGIVEGDRLASINGMDLRVPREEAGDTELSRARTRRLNQEIAKLAPGDAVTLTVVSGGRQREVKLNAVKASDLSDADGMGFFFGDGAFSFPHLENFKGNFRIQPRAELRTLPRGGTYFFDTGKIRAEIQGHIDRAIREAGRSMERGDVREKHK
jgi:S1-C subfamily serine protease